jgi:hypothetical protein
LAYDQRRLEYHQGYGERIMGIEEFNTINNLLLVVTDIVEEHSWVGTNSMGDMNILSVRMASHWKHFDVLALLRFIDDNYWTLHGDSLQKAKEIDNDG